MLHEWVLDVQNDDGINKPIQHRKGIPYRLGLGPTGWEQKLTHWSGSYRLGIVRLPVGEVLTAATGWGNSQPVGGQFLGYGNRKRNVLPVGETPNRLGNPLDRNFTLIPEPKKGSTGLGRGGFQPRSHVLPVGEVSNRLDGVSSRNFSRFYHFQNWFKGWVCTPKSSH